MAIHLTRWGALTTIAASIVSGGCGQNDGQAPAPAKSAASGANGEKSGGSGGGNIVTYPLEAAQRVKVTLALGQVKHALELHRAEHGAYPKSQDEFEKLIIEPNRIQVPAGRRLIYDPKTGAVALDPPE